ncbi:hypothetical protein F4803DRAFT_559805 [Xylaria telfairii]|nr:hypothetical protein F4803DRAFT_559805 [Xylaria telfairii]
MGWLNLQIKQDILTQSQHLLESFVGLLHMHSYAEIEPFNLTQVDEVFNRWLGNDAVQNPAYTRRYLITQQDVHRLFSKETGRFQNSGAPSLFGHLNDGGDGCLPTLLCERENNNVRNEKESVNLQQDTSLSMPPRGTQHSRFPTTTETVEIDKRSRSNELPNTDTILSRLPSDTHSQDATIDDAATTLGDIIVIESSPDAEMQRRATRADHRGRKYKVHDDLELSIPPKNYICRRCDEPGHWIQYCPTNLDPRYDQAPGYDYRCNFCGQKGDHFATLCSKNPHEGSLTKQREHAIAEIREPRTPTRSSQHHYQSRESSATRVRDRYRLRSPEQRARERYRSRTPEHRRSRSAGTDDYGTQTLNEDDKRRQRRKDESDVSPYTARVRLTREFHMSSGNDKERGFSSGSWDDPFRFEHRPNTPPPLHRGRFPSLKKPRRGRRDLDKVAKTDEGRLAYDDESELGPKSSPHSAIASPQRQVNTGSIGGEEAALSSLSSLVVAPEDLNQVKIKAEDFLTALAAEFMLKQENISRSMETDTNDDKTGADGDQKMKDYMEGSEYSDTAIEPEPPAVQTSPRPKYRLVQCPPFRPEVVPLFYRRANPIINSRANRKTASQMMERSENIWTHRSG